MRFRNDAEDVDSDNTARPKERRVYGSAREEDDSTVVAESWKRSSRVRVGCGGVEGQDEAADY